MHFEKASDEVGQLTVQRGSDPMQDRPPQVHPTDEMKVVRWVVLLLEDVEDRLVKDSNGP